MAQEVGGDYYLIECVLPDLVTLQSRIDSKQLMTSQPAVATLESHSRPGAARITDPHLVVDTRQPAEVCLAKALEYLGR